MELEIAVALIILFAIVFLATIDIAFSQLSDVSLHRLTSDTVEDARVNTPFMREILGDRHRFRFTLSASIQVLLIIFSVLVTLIVYNFYQTPRELLGFSLLITLILSGFFRQFVPRFITWRNSENKLLFLLRFVRPVYRLMVFFADPFEYFFRDKEQQKFENNIVPSQAVADEIKEDNADDKQAFIEMGEAEGILEEKDRQLMETMFEFAEIKAGEIMTPRTEIVALPIDSTVQTARDLIIEEKYSRLPIYRETIDNIEGVIYVRDLLNKWAEGGENQKIEHLLRPAYFVPETKSISELLKNMQLNRFQVAMVIDEYGGVAGLITVEDILEEIVGEIEDEDTEEEEVVEIIEGADKSYFDVLGSTDISKIERLFDIEIEDDDFTTIAGLVTSEAGYIPKPGETINVRGLHIEVLQSDEKRIYQLRLRKAFEESDGDEISDEN